MPATSAGMTLESWFDLSGIRPSATVGKHCAARTDSSKVAAAEMKVRRTLLPPQLALAFGAQASASQR